MKRAPIVLLLVPVLFLTGLFGFLLLGAAEFGGTCQTSTTAPTPAVPASPAAAASTPIPTATLTVAAGPVAGLTAAQSDTARIITGTVNGRGIGNARTASTLLVDAALTLSNLTPPPAGGTGLGLGVNQVAGIYKLPGSFGTVAARSDTATATRLVLDKLVANPMWQLGDAETILHQVLGTPPGAGFDAHLAQAATIVTALTTPITTPTPAPTIDPGKDQIITAAPAPTQDAPDQTGCGTSGGYSGGFANVGGPVPADQQALAKQLMQAIDDGRLVSLKNQRFDYEPQIQWIADGIAKPNCGIDTRILQVMVLALRTFHTVGFSDINRRCYNDTGEGAGTSSAHYAQGGGHAVDFWMLGGKTTNGADAAAIQLIRALDPVLPAGSRAGEGWYLGLKGLQHITEFTDNPSSLHIDVLFAKGPLTLENTP